MKVIYSHVPLSITDAMEIQIVEQAGSSTRFGNRSELLVNPVDLKSCGLWRSLRAEFVRCFGDERKNGERYKLDEAGEITLEQANGIAYGYNLPLLVPSDDVPAGRAVWLGSP